jgi:release factor glutamine methyltransferase
MMREESQLLRDKYDGVEEPAFKADRQRLAKGEPLAYVIGWVPFLGLRVGLDSRPLIPRPETEWWTENMLAELAKNTNSQIKFLDLCAGSGAIGLAVLAQVPHARVTFAELVPEHASQITENIKENNLDASKARVVTGDLFESLADEKFDLIAANPPYIPAGRVLDASVTDYEPATALFAGADGLDLIRRIAVEAPTHLNAGGQLWLECDVEHAEAAKKLLEAGAKRVELRTDQFERPRLLVSYY